MAEVLSLNINHTRYDWWQRVNIRQSIDELAHGVELEFSGAKPAQLFKYDANTVAEVRMNNVLVSTVRADVVRQSLSNDSHTISFSGRSLGRELIDCQYSIALKNQHLSDIVNRLCTLFKVPFKAMSNTPLVPDFAMQAESPANAILNAARAGNYLIYAQADGGLQMAAPADSPSVATLVFGENIKSYTLNNEYRLRFSEYYVKSFDYDNNTPRKGVVVDSGLAYFRPMHIVADRHGQAIGALESRATLERNRRSARAHSIELELFGWGHTTTGHWQPWQINTQVRVVIAESNIDEVMLIGELNFTQDAQNGTTTRMTLMPRDAFIGETQSKKQSAAHRRRTAR